MVELPLDEAENTIHDYLDLCNQEGSSHHHHHHHRRTSSFSEPNSLPDGPIAEAGDVKVGGEGRGGGAAAAGDASGADGESGRASPSFVDGKKEVEEMRLALTSTESPVQLGAETMEPSSGAAKTTSTPVVGKKHNYMRPFKCSECGKRSNW